MGHKRAKQALQQHSSGDLQRRSPQAHSKSRGMEVPKTPVSSNPTPTSAPFQRHHATSWLLSAIHEHSAPNWRLELAVGVDQSLHLGVDLGLEARCNAECTPLLHMCLNSATTPAPT